MALVDETPPCVQGIRRHGSSDGHKAQNKRTVRALKHETLRGGEKRDI